MVLSDNANTGAASTLLNCRGEFVDKMNPYIEHYTEGLPEKLAHELEGISAVSLYAGNAVIYRQGDDAECFYYIKKGRVRIFITSENGMEKTLSVVSKGAILGEAAFFDGQPRMSSAKAIQKCELVDSLFPVLKKIALTDMVRRNPDTALELLRLQAQTIRMLSSQVDSITFDSAEQRILHLLSQSMQNSGDNTIVITHEEIGNAVGVSRVTVSKIMSRLCSEGIIQTGYRCIKVLRPLTEEV